ncbi:MAG: diguanylate cyclase [Chloroflexi bacterium]|nr:MAG: diguanylate cyclase [Chloroflexota bacterium]
MEVKLYFRMLQRGWWIIAITTLAAILVALVASYLATPVYRATSRFVISPSAAFIAEGNNVLNSLATLDKRSIITTYAEILNSPRIHRETFDLLQLNEADLQSYTYSAVVLPDTNIIEFSVQGTDPKTVALLVNGIGQHVVEYVQGLYMVYEMTLLDPSVVPVEPISPQPARDAGVALVVGLAMGVMLALVRELVHAPIENFMQERKVDPVSLALNRAVFERKLAEAAFASANDFSFCLVHLEGLTNYINVLPQSSLQTMLRHVNQTLRNQLRGNDLVGRWSELDFAVMLFETPGDASVNTMGRVRMALSVPIKIAFSGEDLYLNPQIGIAEYRVGDTVESMVKNVNWALDVAEKNNNGMYLLKATQAI